jgi:hypothetical protein
MRTKGWSVRRAGCLLDIHLPGTRKAILDVGQPVAPSHLRGIRSMNIREEEGSTLPNLTSNVRSV